MSQRFFTLYELLPRPAGFRAGEGGLGAWFPGTYTWDFMDKEALRMKEQRAGNGTVDEGMEVVHCVSCGAYLGRVAPGSLVDMRCAKCKDDFNVNFRESTPTLKRMKSND